MHDAGRNYRFDRSLWAERSAPPRRRRRYTPARMESAAELFVRCLENEGVRHVFGIPGEETLDLNEALDGSASIEFVRRVDGTVQWVRVTGRIARRTE